MRSEERVELARKRQANAYSAAAGGASDPQEHQPSWLVFFISISPVNTKSSALQDR